MTRKQLVDELEELAERFRNENLDVRLVLTALAAAVHVGYERELARHVADFDRLDQLEAEQHNVIERALAILNAGR